MKVTSKFSDTNLCVKCGLCLPHCPTYGKTQDENESPRGRISLIQGWANGKLELQPKLQQHIDHCLLCRACERVCPAQVPYGRLVDDFSREAGKSKPRFPARLALAILRRIVRNKPALARTNRLLRSYQVCGARSLFKRLGLLKFFGLTEQDFALPEIPERRLRIPCPARQTGKMTVGLFTGCMGELLDTETSAAAQRVLEAMGIGVQIPGKQTCCGALDLHAGSAGVASALAKQNGDAFNSKYLDAVLSIASGCGATLAEYGVREKLEDTAKALSPKVRDVSDFISSISWPVSVSVKPLNAKVCVHTPCTLKNVLDSAGAPSDVLARIPGIDLSPLPENTKCCGAAGSYMLEYPRMARSLRDDVIAAIEKIRPDFLATSNIGCALHIRAGLRARGLSIEVLHPLVLLDRQIDY